VFCRPKDAETVFVENLERQIEMVKNSTEISEERRQRFLSRVEENRAEANDKLFQRLGWMPRQPPIMLTDKRMMLGLYSDTFNCSMFAFTEDAGQTWEFSRPLGQRGIQPSVVRKKDGNLVAFMRDSPVVRRAESSDGGMTWSEDPIDIANSGASVAVLGLKSGNWILAVNDLPQGRERLTCYLSEDEGKTWPIKRAFEDLEPKMGTASYPTLLQTPDGSIHITYTHQDKKNFEGETIKHVRFNEAWITAQ
jgi:predicted neuraminidase